MVPPSVRPSPIWMSCAASALLLAAAIYWPGLSGGFVFDDFSFIVWNDGLHVEHMRLGEWVRAALSFPADHQGRWLTMLSFAANHYLHGLTPFGYKLVNLAIHLVNGVLLYLVVARLLALWAAQRPEQGMSTGRGRWLALLIATLWLVLPINLTAVLYITQRLESLSHLFVLAGLAWYLRARISMLAQEGGVGRLMTALIVPTALGLLAKESAILLPLYAACVEATFFNDARTQPIRRSLLRMYGLLLLLPLAIGLVWLASWIGTEHSYARAYTTTERLLTEARVFVHYMQWTLLPLPNDLTLYHDDIKLSTALLSPPQTLAAIAFLTTLMGVAAAQMRCRPMLSIGLAWFFAGHLLTGTVIPLELVFEHRNYFPSIGLLLAAVSLAAEALRTASTRTLTVCAVVVISFYAFTTAMRATEWSSPSRLALSEAIKRPDSPRAQYEFAYNALQRAGSDPNAPLRVEAKAALERCRRMPGSDTQCEVALILDANTTSTVPDPALWAAMTSKLRARMPGMGDYSAAATLYQCQLTGRCYFQPDQLKGAVDAALSHPHPGAVWLDLSAQIDAFFLRDADAALAKFREVARLQPANAITRGNLVRVLIMFGHLPEAERELQALERLNHLGAHDELIRRLRRELDQRAASMDAMPLSALSTSSSVKTKR